MHPYPVVFLRPNHRHNKSFLEFLPGIQKVPEYLQVIGYKSPEDPLFAPLQYAHNFKQDGFSWLCENPAALTRFNAFMEGQRADRPHWADWFPIPDQILASAHKGSDGPLLVDIGGGRGHDLLGFKQRFPEAPGKLVLEDLPTVIEEARSALDLEDNGIDAVGYDFFAQEQPIKGKDLLSVANTVRFTDKGRLKVPVSTTSGTSSTTGQTIRRALSSRISSLPWSAATQRFSWRSILSPIRTREH